MSVYIVRWVYGNESGVESVWDTEESAQKEADRLNNDEPHISFTVQNWTVQTKK